MPKIPVYENRTPLAPGRATRAGGWAEPFQQVEGQVARTGGLVDRALENMRTEPFHSGEQVRRGIAAIRQSPGDSGAGLMAAGAAIAGAGEKFATWMENQDKQKKALDLTQRSTDMTKEFLDWYYPELEKAQGLNAEGFAERVKSKRGELAAKYSEGLEGEYAAKFHLSALQDYERDLKAAAGHQFSERQKTVEEQTQKLAQDAIAKSGFVTSPDQMDAILADVDVSYNMLHPGRDNRADIQKLQTQVIDGAMRVAASAKNFAMADGLKSRYGDKGIVDPGSVAAVNQIKDAAEREQRQRMREAAADAREARAERRREAGYGLFKVSQDASVTDDQLLKMGLDAGVDVSTVEHLITQRNVGTTNAFDLQRLDTAIRNKEVASEGIPDFVAKNNLRIKPGDQMVMMDRARDGEIGLIKAEKEGRKDEVVLARDIVKNTGNELQAMAKAGQIDPVVQTRVVAEADRKVLSGELSSGNVHAWMMGQISKAGAAGTSVAETKERLIQTNILGKSEEFSEREWEKAVPDEGRRRALEATLTNIHAAQGKGAPTPDDLMATLTEQADAPARPKDVPPGAIYLTYLKKDGGKGRAWFWMGTDGLKNRTVR